MSDTATRNLGREKVQQILASVGSQKTDDSDKVEAAEYDWHQPHYFSSDQLEKLDRFAEKVANGCAQKFTQLYHNDFNVEVISTTQHFANEFADPEKTQNDYYLTVGTAGQIFGLVGIPGQTAAIWTTQLLGDSKSSENYDKDLSQLEQFLLFDITSGIIEVLSDSYDNYDLQPVGEIVGGQIPIEFEGTEELFKITFSVKKPDSENFSEAYFLMLCDKLQAVVGQNVEAGKNISAQDISKAVFDHVQKIPVSVTSRLASTVLTFEEIITLQVDDILLLDKSVNEPAELVFEGRTIFRGQPARAEGNHAVVVTEICSIK